MTKRCGNTGGRHWFTVYGIVGARAPICQRYGCDAINPRALSADEIAEYETWLAQGWAVKPVPTS